MGRSWLARQSRAPQIGNEMCVANLLENLPASRDSARLQVTVGANSNVGERGTIAALGRAPNWEVDTHSGHRAFAAGLCDPNGLAWATAAAGCFATAR